MSICDENKKKQIDHFFKSLGKFSECLTSDLASYDFETKNKIKKELKKLINSPYRRRNRKISYLTLCKN